jgi:hypothetical protein
MSGIVVISVLAAVALCCVAVGCRARYGRRRLRAPFGAEVGRVAQEHGGPRAVDRELRRRKSLNDGLLLRAISAPDHDAFARSWSRLQHEFAANPASALSSAERLVAQLLDARGYPGVDAADQLALLSVEHPDVLAGYRRAQQVSRQTRTHPGTATARELSSSLASCRAVVVELLVEPGPSRTR